jgi:hypothetical protein
MKSVLGKMFVGPLSFVFGAIEEAFTGDLQEAFSLGDGVMGKLLGIIVGGFDGILTAIPRVVDGIANSILEGLGFSFKLNSTGFIQYVESVFVDFFKMLGSLFTGGLSNLIGGVFGKNVPWAKSLRDTSDSIDASIEKSSAIRARLGESLLNQEGKTLQDIGKEQKKGLDTQAAAIKGSVTNVTDAFGLASNVNATVRAAQAGMPTMDSTTSIATPTQTKVAGVTQPAVNTPQTEEKGEKQGQAASTATTSGPTTMEQMLAIAQQQLDVLKQMLLTAQSKEDPLDTFAKLSARPRLQSSNMLFDLSVNR